MDRVFAGADSSPRVPPGAAMLSRRLMAIEPVRRSHAEARDTYDRISRIYDWLEGPFETRARKAGLRLLDVRAGEHVLDIGHGSGQALRVLAHRTGQTGLATGIDLSAGMQQLARRRLDRVHLDTPVALARADAVRLPYRGGRFDAAFMSFVLELFDTPEIPTVLAEAQRVLRPGGRLGVVALGLTDHPGLMPRLYLAGHRHLPRLLDCRPIPTRHLVHDAGYHIDIATTTTTWGLPIDILIASKPRAPVHQAPGRGG